jgi:hypothetical protein
MDATELMDPGSLATEKVRLLQKDFPGNVELLGKRIIGKDFLAHQELMLISYRSWKSLIATKSTWLEDIPSVLILKNQSE